jgi:hypothetical protein
VIPSGVQRGRDGQPAVLKVGLLRLDHAQLGAERGELGVVGGVRGQFGGQLVLPGRQPVKLALEPLQFLSRGPLLC